MRSPKKSPQAVEYVAAVNRAIDWILTHLDRTLPLDEIAERAAFSPFHFHRVFRSVTGETLARFVKRVRLERAVQLARHSPGRSWTAIALDCGFSSSADFSRSFKQYFGRPPRRFDIEGHRAERRDQWTEKTSGERHCSLLERLPPGENPDGFEVELLSLAPRTVAYSRVVDSFRPRAVSDAAAELLAWAEARRLAEGTWYGYMWDDPEVVAHQDCRYDVAVEVDPSFRPEGAVGRFDFPAMTVAVLPVSGAIDLEQRALDWLFDTWLPTSGHFPTDQPCFEVWRGRPFAHGLEHFELDLHLPVTSVPAAHRR